jgi:hypothetical protein
MAILTTPAAITPQLQPAAEQVALATNYITSFNFATQYLPDTYEKEFERYGNRSISSFLRMVGAELPSNSDQIKWAEQGRLHIKYTSVGSNGTTYPAGSTTALFQINDTGVTSSAIRVGQTVLIQRNSTGVYNKGLVISVSTPTGGPYTFTAAFYESGGLVTAGTAGNQTSADFSVFIYGSEFKKGQNGMVGSLEAETNIFSNNPIILKDRYAVNGSDMAQIGWVEISTEDGASGYLWYLKSQHETRLRFDDYIETSMLEAVPAESGSGVATQSTNTTVGNMGSQGVFYVVNARGNVWGAGYPTALSDWDNIVFRLDKQGAIEENALFVNRDMSFAIDNMLAGLNGLGTAATGGTAPAQGASFGLFDNDVAMALNLGFTGFRRGYDFYKSDWKYLNDPTMRGGMNTSSATANGTITGLLVPAGSTSVYDQIMGKNAKRPFLHVRYRATEAEDRRYKTWVTGSAGGASTSDLDAMEVHFLSERCVCTLGANNFMLFRYGA